jgi:hypothetical protein
MGLVEFNYGNKEANLQAYKQETPPIVSFSNLGPALPIALVIADSDAFTETNDATWLSRILQKQGSLALDLRVPGNHESLLIGKDMSYFGNKILPLIN